MFLSVKTRQAWQTSRQDPSSSASGSPYPRLNVILHFRSNSSILAGKESVPDILLDLGNARKGTETALIAGDPGASPAAYQYLF